MNLSQVLMTLVVVFIGAAGCADELPVAGTYVPTDCPPCAGTTGESAEAQLPEQEIDVEEEMVFVANAADGEPAPHAELSEAAGADEPQAVPVEPETKSAAGKIDINSASAIELTALPGVGPALAARIIEYREQRAFESAPEILRVRGIGPAKFAKLREQVTVGR